MKKTIFLLMIFAMLSVLAAETVVLSPTDDMYTDAEHAGTPPVTTELWTATFPTTGHFERIMIKFDLDSYSDMTLVSAQLHLTRFFSCPSSGTTASNFFAIMQDWDESTWNYTQHTAYDENINMPFVFSGNGGDAITHFDIDVTDFINNWFLNSIDNHGFVIIAESNQKFSKFYSKEFTNTEFQPALTLEFANSATESNEISAPVITASNYPNPFNPTTTICYEIPETDHVCIDLYNPKGQFIDCLLSSFKLKGTHSLTFNGCSTDGSPLHSGVYFYQIKTSSSSCTGRMVLLK